MPYAHPDIFTDGLEAIPLTGLRLDLLHTEPTTFTEATETNTVAYKESVSGELVTVSASEQCYRIGAITDGIITTTSTDTTDDAAFWALTDPATSKLWLTGPLGLGVMVTVDKSFILPQFSAVCIKLVAGA